MFITPSLHVSPLFIRIDKEKHDRPVGWLYKETDQPNFPNI